MTTDPSFSASGPPGEGGGPTTLSPVRAVVVLALFVVAAVTLVGIGTRPAVSGEAQPPATTTTIAHHGGTGTTTTTTIPHSSVTVLVANATSEAMLAAHYTTLLATQGWKLETPTDASVTETASSVYYAAGQQEAAASIATSLGLQPSAVLPLTSAVPVPGATGNDVVVVVGANLVTAG